MNGEVKDLLDQVDLAAASEGDWFVAMRTTDNGSYAGFEIQSKLGKSDHALRVAILPDGQMPHQRANARILAGAPRMLKMLQQIEKSTVDDDARPKWLEDLKALLDSI